MPTSLRVSGVEPADDLIGDTPSTQRPAANTLCQAAPVSSCLRGSGCRNRTAQTGPLKQQACRAHSSGGWKSKIRLPLGSGSNENLPLGSQTVPLAVSSHGRERPSLTSLLIKALIPFVGAPPS